MIVHFFTGIFEFVKEVKQFRVVQKELDSITIEYIPDINFNNEVLTKVEKTIQVYLKEPYIIYWEKVENIPATGSGKPQIIKSYIENKL
jgi:phenylacetate-CoA ligase